MIKYVDTKVVFQEVPDEVTLAINISNCPCKCDSCHSPYLAEDIGDYLDAETLDNLLKNNVGITCICFMGGDANPGNVNHLASYIKKHYYNIKTAWYSGRQEISKDINPSNFDFIKVGSYIPEFGPLNNKTTNQRFYKVVDNHLIDITEKFWE